MPREGTKSECNAIEALHRADCSLLPYMGLTTPYKEVQPTAELKNAKLTTSVLLLRILVDPLVHIFLNRLIY